MSDHAPNNACPIEPEQGAQLSCASPAEQRSAMEAARDYRGDVTIELTDGTSKTGFVFDIDSNGGLRLDDSSDGTRHTIDNAIIASIHCSGRDPAAGKSWENWVRRYAEKKLAGEDPSLHNEELD